MTTNEEPIKYLSQPTPEEIRAEKQTRFDAVNIKSGAVLKYLITRKDPDENHIETTYFLAGLQPKFTHIAKLDAERGTLSMPEVSAYPPDAPILLVAHRVVAVLFGRESMPPGYLIRGAKIEPPKKKRTKKARPKDDPDTED